MPLRQQVIARLHRAREQRLRHGQREQLRIDRVGMLGACIRRLGHLGRRLLVQHILDQLADKPCLIGVGLAAQVCGRQLGKLRERIAPVTEVRPHQHVRQVQDTGIQQVICQTNGFQRRVALFTPLIRCVAGGRIGHVRPDKRDQERHKLRRHLGGVLFNRFCLTRAAQDGVAEHAKVDHGIGHGTVSPVSD